DRNRPSGCERDDPPPAALLIHDLGESQPYTGLELLPRREPRRDLLAADPCLHHDLEHSLESPVFLRRAFGTLILFGENRHAAVSVNRPRQQDPNDPTRIILVEFINNSRCRQFRAIGSVSLGGKLGGPDLPDARARQDIIKPNRMLGPE